MKRTCFLISEEEDINERLGEPLRTSVLSNNRETINLLIKLKVSLNLDVESGISLLTEMCEIGNLDNVDMLCHKAQTIDVEKAEHL